MSAPFSYGHFAVGSRGPLEVKEPGGSTWWPVPMIRNVNFSPTSPSDTTVDFVDSPSQTRSGQSGPGSATYDLTRVPTLRGYRIVADAFDTGAILEFRDWGGTEPTFETTAAGVTLAVATTGVGTLVGVSAGTAANPATMFTPGRLVYPRTAVGAAATPNAGLQVLAIERVTGGDKLLLSRFGTVTTKATATEPAQVTEDDTDTAITVVNAGRFGISQPGTLRTFSGRVTSVGGYQRQSGGQAQQEQLQINLQPNPQDLIVLEPAQS